MSWPSSPPIACDGPQRGSRARPQTVPAWERSARTLLQGAAGRIRLLGWATPLNWRDELGQVFDDWQRGNERLPRFIHARAQRDEELAAQLARTASCLARRGRLGELYAARARELSAEQRMTEVVGTSRFGQLADRRYRSGDGFELAADHLAERWLQLAPTTAQARPHVVSDDDRCPLSLLRGLQREIAAHRLPHRVVGSAGLAALAATGPSTIYVAKGLPLSRAAVKRTVLHEIHGHALPRQRAARTGLGIFTLGTARGTDDQEGRALALEEQAGWLGPERRVELALRHLAARSVQAGADFVQTARQLARYPVPLMDRLRIAARVHRGGGLARERVYLPAYLRVRDACQRDPTIDRVLRCGAVAVEAAGALRPWVG